MGMGALDSFICDGAFSALGPSWGMPRLWDGGSHRSGAVPPQLPNKMSEDFLAEKFPVCSMWPPWGP